MFPLTSIQCGTPLSEKKRWMNEWSLAVRETETGRSHVQYHSSTPHACGMCYWCGAVLIPRSRFCMLSKWEGKRTAAGVICHMRSFSPL